MTLRSTFTVPGAAADVFARSQVLSDLARCVPGLVVTSDDGEVLNGRLTPRTTGVANPLDVRLTVGDTDPSARRMVLAAAGRGEDADDRTHVLTSITITDDDPTTQGRAATSQVVVEARTPQSQQDTAQQEMCSHLIGRLFDQFVCNLQATLCLSMPGLSMPGLSMPGRLPQTTPSAAERHVAGRDAPETQAARPHRTGDARGDVTHHAIALTHVAQRALPVVVALSIGVVIGRTIRDSPSTTKERS